MPAPNAPAAPATIALVDDDQNILASVSVALEEEGFAVVTYADGAEALSGLSAKPVNLIVLDIKMPRMDGIALLSNLRRHSDVPVIFLTSKDEEEDQLEGLRLGADDYITKPFSQKLLIERIRAVLRRRAGAAAAGTAGNAARKDKSLILRGDLVLDSECHICTWKGKPVPLTVTEFLILQSLVQRPGHVKSRDQLMDAAYGEHIYVDDRTIDSHIKRLRKKFRVLDPGFDGVETLYGIGYRYQAPG